MDNPERNPEPKVSIMDTIANLTRIHIRPILLEDNPFIRSHMLNKLCELIWSKIKAKEGNIIDEKGDQVIEEQTICINGEPIVFDHKAVRWLVRLAYEDYIKVNVLDLIKSEVIARINHLTRHPNTIRDEKGCTANEEAISALAKELNGSLEATLREADSYFNWSATNKLPHNLIISSSGERVSNIGGIYITEGEVEKRIPLNKDSIRGFILEVITEWANHPDPSIKEIRMAIVGKGSKEWTKEQNKTPSQIPPTSLKTTPDTQKKGGLSKKEKKALKDAARY